MWIINPLNKNIKNEGKNHTTNDQSNSPTLRDVGINFTNRFWSFSGGNGVLLVNEGS